MISICPIIKLTPAFTYLELPILAQPETANNSIVSLRSLSPVKNCLHDLGQLFTVHLISSSIGNDQCPTFQIWWLVVYAVAFSAQYLTNLKSIFNSHKFFPYSDSEINIICSFGECRAQAALVQGP